MEIIIRMMNESDIKDKAYVHYKSYQETYRGVISDKYVKNITLKKCINISKKDFKNTIIAVVDNEIVGFACYGKSKDKDLCKTLEIAEIYILKEYQRNGIGGLLANNCFEKMSNYNKVSVWVLSENYIAINFYKKYGFKIDGAKKIVELEEHIEESRMMKNLH